MAVDAQLLEILVCPRSKKPLIYFEAESFLFCPDSRLRYQVEDDIPVMLPEEAELLDEAQCRELMERARQLGLIDS